MKTAFKLFIVLTLMVSCSESTPETYDFTQYDRYGEYYGREFSDVFALKFNNYLEFSKDGIITRVEVDKFTCYNYHTWRIKRDVALLRDRRDSLSTRMDSLLE